MKNENPLSTHQAKQISTLALAFIGDAVTTAYVRERLVTEHDYKPNVLHKMASDKENCTRQSQVIDMLLPKLTQQESEIFMRGRNSKTGHLPKNGNVIDYRKATGFEAVVGFLYLTGQNERMNELLGELYC